MILLSILIFFVSILLSVAYLTLFEHFFLSLVQIRLGPSKVGFMGLLQPIFDGIKLMQKELLILDFFVMTIYFFMPLLNFILSLLFFFILVNFFLMMKMDFFFLFLFVSFMLYFFLMVSFFSKSKYSVLGSIRSAAQALSFDIVFIFFIFIFIFFFKGLSFKYNYNFILSYSVFLMILSLFLAEMNRAPFDFSEGESELVSGYNLELGSFLFTLFFLSEYILIFFYSFLLGKLLSGLSLLIGFISFLILLGLRGVLPRYRYDKMMSFFWFYLMPLVFLVLEVFLSLNLVGCNKLLGYNLYCKVCCPNKKVRAWYALKNSEYNILYWIFCNLNLNERLLLMNSMILLEPNLFQSFNNWLWEFKECFVD